ncbi:hypothetical protein C2S52_014212 [Perilla frutescens var. hirtella]|nr:hypothetical protein C2S52_014212 [Perilla frutescens var. hirtella]
MDANHIRRFFAPRRGRRIANTSDTRSFGDRRRNHLLAEFHQQISSRNLVNAEEETSSQDVKIDVQNQVTLSDDLLFKILILLPADSLFRLQFVCKNWFGLINSSIFIRCHAQQSEFVLICRKLTPPDQGFEDKPKSFFHVINIEDGGNNFMESRVVELVCIQSSYDGLILATTANNRSLILMNLLTRKHVELPSGTKGYFYVESFDIIASCDEAKKTHNVVHLFRDYSGCTGCETLSIHTRKWRRVDEPPRELLSYSRQIPVTVGGSLYWLFTNGFSEYFFLSLNLRDGKFIRHDLPVTSSSRDRLFDIDGNLGLVTHAEVGVMQVWILSTDSVKGENWVRKYSINLSVYTALPNPICCWKNGKGMVVEMGNGVYVLSFETGEMKLIRSRSDDEVCLRRVDDDYIPHRNTLVSWEDI